MHRHSICHRDFKSANTVIMPDGVIKICDFGTSRRLENNKQTEMVYTTLWYRSPELLYQTLFPESDLTCYGIESDVWSFGICFLDMLIANLDAWEQRNLRSDDQSSKSQLEMIVRSFEHVEIADVSEDEICKSLKFQGKKNLVRDIMPFKANTVILLEMVLCVCPRRRITMKDFVTKFVPKDCMAPDISAVTDIGILKPLRYNNDDGQKKQNTRRCFAIAGSWLFDICREACLSKQSYFLAMQLFRKEISTRIIARDDIQLMAAAYLSIASLYCGFNTITPEYLFDMCGKIYTVDLIRTTIRVVFERVRGILYLPTSYSKLQNKKATTVLFYIDLTSAHFQLSVTDRALMAEHVLQKTKPKDFWRLSLFNQILAQVKNFQKNENISQLTETINLFYF